MKALSVKQPYASLIALGQKPIEFRSWYTHYRGRLLICASKEPYPDCDVDLPCGVTVCVVELVDVRAFKRRDANSTRRLRRMPKLQSWILESPQLVNQIPITGQRGLFVPPPSVVQCLGL